MKCRTGAVLCWGAGTGESRHELCCFCCRMPACKRGFCLGVCLWLQDLCAHLSHRAAICSSMPALWQEPVLVLSWWSLMLTLCVHFCTILARSSAVMVSAPCRNRGQHEGDRVHVVSLVWWRLCSLRVTSQRHAS
jgi:hypothetical protein